MAFYSKGTMEANSLLKRLENLLAIWGHILHLLSPEAPGRTAI